MELRLRDQEKRLLLEILEERHRNLIHEMPPTDHRDFKHELQGRCSVIEGILRKMQAQKNVQLSSTTQLAAFAMCSGFGAVHPVPIRRFPVQRTRASDRVLRYSAHRTRLRWEPAICKQQVKEGMHGEDL